MLATDLEIRDVVRRDGRGMAERHADYHVEMGRLEKFYGALVTEGR